MSDEQGKAPTRVTKWDTFALFTSALSEIFSVLATSADIATEMLQTQASFVDDRESFHEYAARTIETLQEDE